MSQIKLTYKGKEYTLEFTRLVARQMEQQGFNVQEIDEKPMTMIPMLWEGAFRAHHTGMKRTLYDEIYKSIPKKVELIGALGELYAETINTLMDDAPETEGNATWEVLR